MAKKKKKSKVGATRRKPRSRVGATNGFNLNDVLTVIATTAVVSYAEKFIPDSIDSRITAAVKMAAGAGLPALSKDPKTIAILKSAGNVLLSTGTKDMMKGLGILAGAEDGNDLFIAMNGNDLRVINGNEEFPGSGGDVLAGGEDDLSVINGYEDKDEMNEEDI